LWGMAGAKDIRHSSDIIGPVPWTFFLNVAGNFQMIDLCWSSILLLTNFILLGFSTGFKITDHNE
ncbi:hypothetical protein ACJX0J_010137, partial [Zea mays]